MAPLKEALGPAFNAITPDFPGYGENHSGPGPYTFERYRAFIRETVLKEGPDSFHLLGWSMGGAVAASYCLEGITPQPRSLILLDATPRFVCPEKNLGIGQHPAAVMKLERMIRENPETGLEDFISRIFKAGEEIPEENRTMIERHLKGVPFPPGKQALVESLKELARADLLAYEKRLGLPVLIIYGAIDKITPSGGQRLWTCLFENITEAPVSSAGHAPHLTRTGEVAGLVTDFLDSLE